MAKLDQPVMVVLVRRTSAVCSTDLETAKMMQVSLPRPPWMEEPCQKNP